MVAGAVLGVRPSDLDGAVVALDDLWGREAALIAERLSEAASWEDRFAWTDAMLARRCAAGHPSFKAVPPARRLVRPAPRMVRLRSGTSPPDPLSR